MLTAYIEKSEIVEPLQPGARESCSRTLRVKYWQAIRRVMAGEYWVRREPVSNLEQYLRTLMQSTQTTANKRRKLMTSRVFVTMAQVTCGSATHAIEPFSSEFDDLGKANTATTSIRDRSSLKIHI